MHPGLSKCLSPAIFEDWMIHPPAVLIDQYISGLLKGEALAGVEGHLKMCSACRDEVEWLCLPCRPIVSNTGDVSSKRRTHIRQMIRDFAARRIRPEPDANWS